MLQGLCVARGMKQHQPDRGNLQTATFRCPAIPSAAAVPRKSTRARTSKGSRHRPNPYTCQSDAVGQNVSSHKDKYGQPLQLLPEPVFDGGGVSLVFLGDEEPDKLGVTHTRLIVHVGVGVAKFGQSIIVRGAAGDRSREYPIDHLGGQRCGTWNKKNIRRYDSISPTCQGRNQKSTG